MTDPDNLEPGAVYHVGEGCGVPFTFRPIRFQLVAVMHHKDSYRQPGTAWLRGAEMNLRATGVRRFVDREIYVITAGMRLLFSPRRAAALARHRARAIYTGPVIPRPRTSTETIPGSTR